MNEIAERTAEQVKDDVIARLDATYTLIYAERDDALTNEQIAVLLKGENLFESDAFSRLEEWESDVRYDRAIEIIKDLCEGDEYDILDADPDALDEVRFAIYDRDDSDIYTALLKNTGSRLFRYDLGYELESDSWRWDDQQYNTAVREIAEAAKLDLTPDLAADLRTLVTEASYGGHLYIMWFGDTEQAVDLASAIEGTEANTNPGTVTFINPTLLILDGLNGSGMDAQVKATITLDIKPGNVTIDAPRTGTGYTWSEVAYPSVSAYRCDVTIHRATR